MWYKVFKVVSNRYFIASAVFIVWVSFFDNSSLIIQHELSSRLNAMEDEIEFYENEIESNKQTIEELNGDLESLEKFARENYLIKKDNEDIFIVVREKE